MTTTCPAERCYKYIIVKKLKNLPAFITTRRFFHASQHKVSVIPVLKQLIVLDEQKQSTHHQLSPTSLLTLSTEQNLDVSTICSESEIFVIAFVMNI